MELEKRNLPSANWILSPAELKFVLSLTASELELFLLELGNLEAAESVLRQVEGWRTSDEIIEEAKRSPVVFRNHVLIQAGPNVVKYGEALDPWQEKDLLAMDDAWAYMARVSMQKPEFQRCYLERGRGHSKTTDIAMWVIWAIMASPSMLYGYAAAASEKQAKLITKTIRQIRQLNPWVHDRILVFDGMVKNPLTGSTCEIVPANDKTTFGETPNFIVADELTHWFSEDVWTTLFSGIVKVPDAVMAVISNAGYGKGRSWQWELREKIREDQAWYFSSLDGVQASWLSAEQLQEQKRILGPKEYRRLFKNKWVTDSTDGIPDFQVERATVLAGPAKAKEHGYDWIIAALDIGVTHDRTSLVFLGCDCQRMKLGLVNHFTWHPSDYASGEIRIADVEETFMLERKRLGRVDAVYADNYQAIASLQQWMELGVRCFEANFSGKQAALMAKRFVDAFRHSQVELYYDKWLNDDIFEIEVQFHDFSRTYRLTAERNERGHADSAFALAIGIMAGVEWLQAVPVAQQGMNIDDGYFDGTISDVIIE